MENYITFPTMQQIWDETNHVIKSLDFPDKWEYEEYDDCGGGNCFNYDCGTHKMILNSERLYVYDTASWKCNCSINLDKFDITTVRDIITKAMPDFNWPGK